MTDFDKSPYELGIVIHTEFASRTNAVLPILSNLLKEEPNAAELLAPLWDITEPNVRKVIPNLLSVSPSSISSDSAWGFLMRSAQCAAAADQRLEAQLVPSRTAAEDPHATAIETIHDVGMRAINLLKGATGLNFPYPGYDPNYWQPQTREVVAKLCVKPGQFRDMFIDFALLSAPEQLPILLREGPRPNMSVIYRVTAAAAVLRQELQIEFMPFNKPFAE